MDNKKTPVQKGQNKFSAGRKHRFTDILLYKKKGETRVFLILSFLIPFILIWIMFSHFEVHPFGDKQILVTDLWHQYFPFFKEEHDKSQKPFIITVFMEYRYGNKFPFCNVLLCGKSTESFGSIFPDGIFKRRYDSFSLLLRSAVQDYFLQFFKAYF